MYCHRIRFSLKPRAHIIVNYIRGFHYNTDINIVGESVQSRATIKKTREEIHSAYALTV